MFRRNDKSPDYEIGGVLHRVCDSCLEPKPLAEGFYLCSDRQSRRHKCKSCNGAERKERGTLWTAEQKRAARIKKLYGLTMAEFDEMFEAQSGRCAICPSELTVDKVNTETNVNIDHCHNSGAVRGLLCSRCNRGLGQFLDSEELLQRAIEYLRRSK